MERSRRTFLMMGISGAAIGTGTYVWLRRAGYAVDPAISMGDGKPRPRTSALEAPPYDARALEVVVWLLEALLPGDPTRGLPGARDAGVIDYVVAASALAGLVVVRHDILKLTRHLERRMKHARGERFMEAPAEARAQLLREAAQDHEPRGRFVPSRAVEATLRLGLEGYLGHPHHGGNRNYAVWDALQIEMPRSRHPAHPHHAP